MRQEELTLLVSGIDLKESKLRRGWFQGLRAA